MNKTELREKILTIVNFVVKNKMITTEQVNENLLDIDITSIDFISIIVALEDEFDIEIPDEKLLLSEMGTINKMVEVVYDII